MSYTPRRGIKRRNVRSHESPDKDYSKGRAVVITGLFIAFLGAIGAFWPVLQDWKAHVLGSFSTQLNVTPRPAPTRNPPVLVTSVTDLVSSVGCGDFALPAVIELTQADVSDLNNRFQSEGNSFGVWAADNGAAAISPAVTSITIVGNWEEEISIRDLKVSTECVPAYTGTYLSVASEGGGDAGRIGLNLERSNPIAQEIGFRSSGAFLTGDGYFERRTISLHRGESYTLSVWVFTERRKCDFSLSLEIATSKGSFVQNVPKPVGFPNAVTAARPPSSNGTFSAAYEELLADGAEEFTWIPISPESVD